MARLIGVFLGQAALIASYGLFDDETVALQASALQGRVNLIVDEDDFGEESEDADPSAHEAATDEGAMLQANPASALQGRANLIVDEEDFGEESEDADPSAHEAATDEGAMLQAKTFAKESIPQVDSYKDSTIEDPNSGAALHEGPEQKMEVKDDAAMLQARSKDASVEINEVGEALHNTVWPTAAVLQLQAQYDASGSVRIGPQEPSAANADGARDGTRVEATAKEQQKAHGRKDEATMLQAQSTASGRIDLEVDGNEKVVFEDKELGVRGSVRERVADDAEQTSPETDDAAMLQSRGKNLQIIDNDAAIAASGRIELEADGNGKVFFEDKELGVRGSVRERVADDAEQTSPETDDDAMLQAKRVQVIEDDNDSNLVFEDAAVASQQPAAEPQRKMHLHQTGGYKRQVLEEGAKALVNQFTPVLSSLARAMDVWPK